MNLIVDFGNTRIKAALFNEHALVQSKVYPTVAELIEDLPFFSKANKCLIGSVTGEHQKLTNVLDKSIKLFEFTSQTPLPLDNLYESASTLGSDRIAASVGAHYFYPQKNVLSIDAGTCIKYNFTNNKDQYLGGAISLGMQLRFKALKDYTHRLPMIKSDDDFDKLIGTSTKESILSGVINATGFEIDGFIDSYKKEYPDLIVVLTGGDTDFFAKRLKNGIFTNPNLVLTGLNQILIYNS